MRTGMLMPLMMTLLIAVGCACAEVRRHVHALNAFEVADRAVDDETGAFRGLHDVVEQVVADDRPTLFLTEEIDHQHVTGLQHVDGRLIRHPAQSGRLRPRVDEGLEIGTERHELHREGAAYQPLSGMKNPEAVCVLVAESLPRQYGQHFLGRQTAGSFDEPIGYFRPAVGKALERILRRQLDHLLFVQGVQLRAQGDGGQQGRQANDHSESCWVGHLGHS